MNYLNPNRVRPHLLPKLLQVRERDESKPAAQVGPPLWREVRRRLRSQALTGRERNLMP